MSASHKLQRFRGGWAIAVYKDGRRLSRRRLESCSAEDAAEEYSQLIAELKKPKDPSIAEVWQLYRDDRQGRAIASNMEWSGRAILPYFGKKKPSGVTIESCRGYIKERRLKGKQDGTIWTELGHLRCALVWAKKSRIISEAPDIERPPKPPPRDRYLTKREFEKLLDSATMPHIRLFIQLAIATAGRLAALLDLTWDRVDFDRGLIHLGDRTFRGRRKGRATVPMTNTIRAALSEAQKGARSDYVIEWAGKKVSKVRRGLSLAAKRAGLKGVSPHVFRHTAAVWMAEAGSGMSEISQFLGHEDSRITERVYGRYSPKYLRKAAKALEGRSARRVR